jgi:hypothetical protein
VFEFRRVASREARIPWFASAALHAIVLAVVVAVGWRVRPQTTFIALSPPVVRRLPSLPPTGGTTRGRGPSGGLGQKVPVTSPPAEQAAPVSLGVPDSNLAVSSGAVGRHMVTTPHQTEGLIWATPRPALPSEVADRSIVHDPTLPLPRDPLSSGGCRMVD